MQESHLDRMSRVYDINSDRIHLLNQLVENRIKEAIDIVQSRVSSALRREFICLKTRQIIDVSLKYYSEYCSIFISIPGFSPGRPSLMMETFLPNTVSSDRGAIFLRAEGNPLHSSDKAFTVSSNKINILKFLTVINKIGLSGFPEIQVGINYDRFFAAIDYEITRLDQYIKKELGYIPPPTRSDLERIDLSTTDNFYSKQVEVKTPAKNSKQWSQLSLI